MSAELLNFMINSVWALTSNYYLKILVVIILSYQFCKKCIKIGSLEGWKYIEGDINEVESSSICNNSANSAWSPAPYTLTPLPQVLLSRPLPLKYPVMCSITLLDHPFTALTLVRQPSHTTTYSPSPRTPRHVPPRPSQGSAAALRRRTCSGGPEWWAAWRRSADRGCIAGRPPRPRAVPPHDPAPPSWHGLRRLEPRSTVLLQCQMNVRMEATSLDIR